MGLPIELPPLRERENDILILAKYFADEFAKENKLPNISFTSAAKEKLIKYSYPGNVRELKAMVELAAVMCEQGSIKADDISYNSARREDLLLTEVKTLKQYTHDIITYYLKKNQDDVMQTAKMLDVGKSTIYKLIQNGEIR